MANHSFSAGVAFALTFIIIGAGQAFKEFLAASRQGTLVAGVLGGLVFLFTLCGISNAKMASSGSQFTSGLGDVMISILVGAVAAASIHRVAVTICLLASGVLLYLTTLVSHERYNASVKPAATITKKK